MGVVDEDKSDLEPGIQGIRTLEVMWSVHIWLFTKKKLVCDFRAILELLGQYRHLRKHR